MTDRFYTNRFYEVSLLLEAAARAQQIAGARWAALQTALEEYRDGHLDADGWTAAQRAYLPELQAMLDATRAEQGRLDVTCGLLHDLTGAIADPDPDA